MLYIDGSIDVDAGFQKLLHVLVPLGVTAAVRIGMGQFIYED